MRKEKVYLPRSILISMPLLIIGLIIIDDYFGLDPTGAVLVSLSSMAYGMLSARILLSEHMEWRAREFKRSERARRFSLGKALLDAYLLVDVESEHLCPTCRRVANHIEKALSQKEDQATIDALVNLKRQVTIETALSPKEWAVVRNVLGAMYNLIQRRDEKDIAWSWRTFCTWQKGLKEKIAPILDKISVARLPHASDGQPLVQKETA